MLQYLSSSSEYHPFRFNQKVYILKHNVCIAFAGIVSSFKTFLEDIRIFCNIHDIITAEILNKFLKGLNDESWEDFSCLIFVVEKENDENRLGIFKQGKWLRKQTDLFGEVWPIGSGGLDFIKETVVKADFSGTSQNEQHFILKINVIMICRLLCSERATLNTVKKALGSGI